MRTTLDIGEATSQILKEESSSAFVPGRSKGQSPPIIFISKKNAMPDKKDIQYIEEELMVKLSEAEDLCRGLIDTAKAYNEQEGQQIYDIDQLKKRHQKIRQTY
jgi:hypothetical protein